MKHERLLSLVAFLLISVVAGENLENLTLTTTTTMKPTPRVNITFAGEKRSINNNVWYADMISCAVRSDTTACLVGVADNFLSVQKNQLLVEADRQVARAMGRADPDNSPSILAKTVEKLIGELAGYFKSGLSSWFTGRESEDDELVDDEKSSEKDGDDEKDDVSRDVGESRASSTVLKKKKKKPLKRVIALAKIALLVGIVAMKVNIFVKLFETALKFKLLLLGFASFLIQAVKFWMDLRSKKGHEEAIVYKNPYEGTAEWSGPGIPGEYHGRSDTNFDYNKSYAANRAYSGYRP